MDERTFQAEMEKEKPNTKEWPQDLRDAFFEKSKPQIRSLVSGYKNIPDPAIELDDLFQVASIAFYQAYDSYIPARGAKFMTYAYRCMQNEMNQQFRKTNASKRRPPFNVIPYDTVQQRDGTEQMGGDNMVISETELANPSLPTDELLYRKEMVEYVHKLLTKLFDEGDRKIFLALSQKLKTQKELAAELGCSQAKISMTYTFMRIQLNYELRQAGFEE